MHRERMISRDRYLMDIVSYVNDFCSVLSDGYNPFVVELGIYRICRTPYEVFYSENNSVHLTECVLATGKPLAQDFRSLLKNYFSWSAAHLQLFSQSRELFQSDFHKQRFMALLMRVQNQLADMLEAEIVSMTEYRYDDTGSETRYLWLEAENWSARLLFGNFIH